MLQITDLTKRFAGVQALNGVSLSAAPGRIHALLGENGAGKSTLLKCLSGVHLPDAGEMRLDGAPYRPDGPRAAEAAGLRIVHQELNLVPGFTAVENVFVGRRYPRRGPAIDRRAMKARVAAAARSLAPDLPLDLPARQLSTGQCQLVEILRALAEEARLLVFDEPTASLSQAEAETLHGVLRKLANAGRAIIFVSHRMDEVFALGDDYTVLRNGRSVGSGRLGNTDRAGIIALMAGKASQEEAPATPARPGAPALAVEQGRVAPHRPAFDLIARQGEIIGLYGLVGSGRSSLLASLWGANPAFSGKVSINGRPAGARGIARRIEAACAYVPEDRRRSGLVMSHSIHDNVILPHLREFRGLPLLLSPRRIRAGVARILDRFRVDYRRTRDRISTLSGGNQQKVMIGRWIRDDTRLLLLDEPTRGVDVGSKAEIHALCRKLAEGGACVVFATSDLEELFQLAGRVLVMAHGAIVLDRPAALVSRRAVLQAAFAETPGGEAAS